MAAILANQPNKVITPGNVNVRFLVQCHTPLFLGAQHLDYSQGVQVLPFLCLRAPRRFGHFLRGYHQNALYIAVIYQLLYCCQRANGFAQPHIEKQPAFGFVDYPLHRSALVFVWSVYHSCADL